MEGKYHTVKLASKSDVQMQTSAFHKLGKQSDFCLNCAGPGKAEVNFPSFSWLDEWISEGKQRNCKI